MKAIALVILSTLLSTGASAAPGSIDLAGEWQVSLEPPSSSAVSWQAIQLPGTLTDAGIGTRLAMKPELNLATLARLQAKFSHVGPAWYRRVVEIPETWAGRRIVLEIERVLWESQVWVDGHEAGKADSLISPHVHDLTSLLPPGRHELLVRIDNREIHPGLSFRANSYPAQEDSYLAHAYTNHTQTLWNGMLGTMRLRAELPVAVEELAVFPRRVPVAAVRIRGRMAAPAGDVAAVSYRFVLRDAGGRALAQRVEPLGTSGAVHFDFDWELPQGVEVRPWSEHAPVFYRLEVGRVDGADSAREVRFGFRELCAEGGQLRLNGERIFLRGTLECAVFPLTGYPPTDVAEWRRIMQRAREWGLNHLRFHSWCPPAAAFEAADESGVYLQVELPHWSLEVGRDPATWAFLRAEALRILAAYGNHPSFMFLSLGNELQGDMEALDTLVEELKQCDARRIYTSTTFTFEKGFGRAPAPNDQFFVTQYTEAGWVRGQGIFNEVAPAFDVDYHATAKDIAVPLITHEIGQYAIYPDLREIERYTGNLVPMNFVAIRDDLARKGLLAWAPRFTEASGEFAALLYKEEIERALRTREVDGFQLLGLQDFPGQGTALVGLLNAFWESKGIMPAEAFREFCGPIVPLARFPKAVYERGETFRAKLEVANFGRDLADVTVAWTIRTDNGAIVGSGSCAPANLPAGGVTPVSEIVVPIPATGVAERREVEVALRGLPIQNRWSIWVYPRPSDDVGGGVRVAATLDEAVQALAAGERVLFAPALERIRGLPGRFVPVFWSPVHFPDQPGTMGLLCDPAHPALREFPTETHSNWQWWDPVLRSRSVVIDGLSVAPIVRVIDNFNRNHALATIFEARVGNGRLVFSAVDVTGDLARRPVARQLRRSLLSYMAGPDFAPTVEMQIEQLRALLLPEPQVSSP